jgi:hypothetical protein
VFVTESPKSSPFRDDVYQSLISVIGTNQLVQVNRYSPYFYRLGKLFLCSGITIYYCFVSVEHGGIYF